MFNVEIHSIRVFFFLGALSWFCHVSAKEIAVGKNHDLQSIKSAIAAADSGDVIYVYEGVYKEGNILIIKSLKICGIGSPVIDGNYEVEVLTINAKNVSVEGFVIQHSGKSDLKELAGIHIINSENIFISNNHLKFNFFGILIENSHHCVIYRNRIYSNAANETSSGNGIHCWKSNALLIESNTIKGHRDGIYFEFVTNTHVLNNRSEKNLRYGIHFMFSNHDVYINNVFSNNGSGVAVMYSRYVNMYYNYFQHNHGGAAYGLLLKELTDSKISGNYFWGNTTGIYLEGTSRTLIEQNVFDNNGWALKILGDCYSDTIRKNNFSKNTFDVSTNSNHSENLFADNYWDKYRGYDFNKDGTGDVPFHPVSLYSKLVEDIPNSVLLMHSFLMNVLDQSEKILPSVTPEKFRDDSPTMKPHAHLAY